MWKPDLLSRELWSLIRGFCVSEAGRQEIDVIVDLGGGRLVAIEVKAGSAPTARDARHLVWLRDTIGKGFVGGIVFHTGRSVFPLEERITAFPVCALWSRVGADVTE